jgi:hypothetical protein
MQIAVDTAKDSPEDIIKVIRLLQDIAERGNAQGNAFEVPQTEGIMKILESQPQQESPAPPAGPDNVVVEVSEGNKEISAGQEGEAQKIIENVNGPGTDILGNPLSGRNRDNDSKEPNMIFY